MSSRAGASNCGSMAVSSRRNRLNKTSPRSALGRRTAARARSAARRKSPGEMRWVYSFGNGKAEGRADMRNLLGGKGAGLAEMANLGLPVPPGFTITTEVCTYHSENDKTYPKGLRRQVATALAQVGRTTGKAFGNSDNPLLVSVRSGARASMQGMNNTVLNIGQNDATVCTMDNKFWDHRCAYGTYCYFSSTH